MMCHSIRMQTDSSHEPGFTQYFGNFTLFSLGGYWVLCTQKMEISLKKNLTIKGEDLNPLFYIIDGLFEN